MSLQFLTHQVAHLEGRLYSGNLSETQYKIESALDKTAYLILNLNALDKLDEAGAFMLYIVTKNAKEINKEIILLCTENEIVKLALSLAGISYFTILPEVI